MVLLIVPTKKFSALKEKGHIWKHHLLINSKLSSLLADCVIEDNVLECTCVSAFFEKCVDKVGLSLSLSLKSKYSYMFYIFLLSIQKWLSMNYITLLQSLYQDNTLFTLQKVSNTLKSQCGLCK